MRAREFIYESTGKNLTITTLIGRIGRPDKFADAIKTPGTTWKTTSGEVVELDPSQAEDVRKFLNQQAELQKQGQPTQQGSLTLKLKGDGTIPSGSLVKDSKLTGGGAQEKEKVGKEIQPSSFWGMKNIPKELQPNIQGDVPNTQAFIDAGGFPAGELFERLTNNPKLQQMNPKLASAIVNAANEVENGRNPSVPADLNPTEVAAFRDYAMEYLGILSLIKGVVDFPESEQFYKHLNKLGATDLSDLILYWPQDVSNPLADSMALTSGETGKSIAISSKAGETGKGAAPSLDGLEIPDYIRKGRRASTYKEVLEFLDVAQSSSGLLQPFELANLLIPNGDMPIAEQVGQFDIDAIYSYYKLKNDPNRDDALRVYFDLVSQYEQGRKKTASGNLLEKLRYYVASELQEAVNEKNALPNFQSAILEILGYNFIQLNTKKQGNEFVTKVNWPAKIRGKITLENKYGATETGAKLCWKLW